MKIETQFDIHNLVKRKFDNSGDEQIDVFEIMNISIETYLSGTQVFYAGRHIQARKEYKDKWKKEDGFVWKIGHSSHEGKNLTWNTYREDELVPVTEEEIRIITGQEKINN